MSLIRAITNKYYFLLPAYLAVISLYRGHRGSFLGWSWLIIKPTIQVAIYAIIFPLITKFEQKNYAYFLLSGILPWTFISNSILEGSYSLINRAEVLKRSLINRTIFPISDVLKHFILLVLSLTSALVIAMVFFIKPNLSILFLPIAMIPMFLFVISTSICASFITPYIRDFNDLLGIAFNILFFFTPVIYPIEAIPLRYQIWFKLNPFYWLIQPIKDTTYYQHIPDTKTYLIALSISLLASLISFLIYKRLRKNLIFYL